MTAAAAILMTAAIPMAAASTHTHGITRHRSRSSSWFVRSFYTARAVLRLRLRMSEVVQIIPI